MSAHERSDLTTGVKHPKISPGITSGAGLDFVLASEALADGLRYLKEQWNWNGSKIAKVLHLSPTTVNGWMRKRTVHFSGRVISPEVEAVIHLLAIHRSLAAMFADSFHQIQWLMTEHPDFGVSPVSKMSDSIAGLILIRQYLDFVRGRGA